MMGLRVILILALVLTIGSVQAGAKWGLEKISNKRFAHAVVGRVSGDNTLRLYAVGRGSSKEGEIQAIFLRDKVMMKNVVTRFDSPGSDISEFTLTPGGWVEEIIDWDESQGTKITIADSCDGDLHLFTEFLSGRLLEHWKVGDKWGSRTLRKKPSKDPSGWHWPRGLYGIDDPVRLISASEALGSTQFFCARDGWAHRPIKQKWPRRGQEVVLLGSGPLPQGGNPNMVSQHFGTTVNAQWAVIGEHQDLALWHFTGIGFQNYAHRYSHMTVGGGRNDLTPRLYVGGFREVVEFSSDPKTSAKGFLFGGFPPKGTSLPLAQEPQFTGKTGGVVVAALRPRGGNSVFVSNDRRIYEFKYDDGHWDTHSFTPEIGEISFIEEIKMPGWRDSRLLIGGVKSGLYILRWERGQKIAITGFSFLKGVEDDFLGFADYVQGVAARNKKCRLLERHRISEVVAENNFRWKGKPDTRTAVRIGSLLGADEIVVGTLAPFFGQVIVVAHIVSVGDSSIIRSVYSQFKNSDEMESAARKLAGTICASEEEK